MRKVRKSKALFGLLPLLAVGMVMMFSVNACDTGDSPDPPTGPDSNYDPLFDEGGPGVTARVRPSTVTVPDPLTGGSATAILVGTYRDSNGNGVSGMQMNFESDPVLVSIDGEVFYGIGFDPPAGYTDSNGAASTTVYVSPGVPPGSYILVAYTSPASGGPNAKGQTTLWVQEQEGERIATPELIGTGSGTTGVALSFIAVGPSQTNLGNPVCYEFDFGEGAFEIFNSGITRASHTYNATGVYLARVRGVKCDGGGATAADFTVVSDWSAPQTVTVGSADDE